MIRTRVGYAGGTTPNPTYYNIGNHSETVQADYDPSRISYEQLLDAFWYGHDPTADALSIQYRSAIFYHNEAQKTAAIESMARQEARRGRKIQTAIIPYTQFFLAEDYHQKYYLRGQFDLFREIAAAYPDANEFVNSTAAARLNGYLAGYGDEATVKSQLDEYGLSEAGKETLLQIVGVGLLPACPVP